MEGENIDTGRGHSEVVTGRPSNRRTTSGGSATNTRLQSIPRVKQEIATARARREPTLQTAPAAIVAASAIRKRGPCLLPPIFSVGSLATDVTRATRPSPEAKCIKLKKKRRSVAANDKRIARSRKPRN